MELKRRDRKILIYETEYVVPLLWRESLRQFLESISRSQFQVILAVTVIVFLCLFCYSAIPYILQVFHLIVSLILDSFYWFEHFYDNSNIHLGVTLFLTDPELSLSFFLVVTFFFQVMNHWTGWHLPAVTFMFIFFS